MPKDLIPYREWLKRTSLIGRPRSRLLRDLDAELERHERFGGGDARWRVEQKLAAWKASKGPGDAWKKTARNKKDFALQELDALLTGKDPESNMPDFLREDMQNARLGVIYLFGHTKVHANVFNVVVEGGLSVAGSVITLPDSVETAMIPGSVLLDAAEGAAYQARTAEERNILRRILDWLQDFAKKVIATLKEKFGEIDLTLAALKNLLGALASTFLAKAAPFISAGMDIVKGLVNTTDAVVERLKAWWKGKGVEILPGHPSVIVDAIKRAMNLGIFQGLYETLKGAGSVGLEFVSAGASTIVNVVVAISETLIKVIWRLAEVFKMKQFFSEASGHWQQRAEERAFHKNYLEFNKWFKSCALKIPALSVLTLNSGICGDKMRFLKMFKDDSQVVSQAEFSKGCTYVDGLKSYGSDYLGNCGFSFYSPDRVVSSMLEFASSHGGGGHPVWSAVKTFVNA